MKHRQIRQLVALLAVLAPAIGAWAGDDAKQKKEDKPDFPKFEEITKDMTVKEGHWTLYHKEKDGKLLARIPTASLKKPFLLGTSISSGSPLSGWQWMDAPVYFERMGKKLVLIADDPRHATGKGTELEDVIERTYTDTILAAIKIVTEAPGGDPVIDLDDLLKTDLSQVAGLFGGSINRSLSRYASIKTFPHNMEIEVALAIMGSGPGAAGKMTSIHYSIAELPKSDYKPRAADDRLGYFLTVVKDWTKPRDAKTVFDRHINRWHLKKVDPSAEVSDVTGDTQIVFYLEKTIPKKYRRYVREGILAWNTAFEKAGLRNAIQVRQQTEHTFANHDPEDMRYSFIRWMVSGRAYAMGPSRANPYTGQIFDADIVVDDSMIRSLITRRWGVFSPKGQSPAHSDPMLESFLASSPEMGWHHSMAEQIAPEFAGEKPTSVEQVHEQALKHLGKHTCDMAEGMAEQLAFAHAMASAAGKRDLPEEFVGQAIRELIMHEVGHTLGLRHNFKASSWLSLSEIKSAASGEQATTGSVMDYNDFTFAASEIEQGQFLTSALGPYDNWVIEYGYKQVAEPFKNEEELLKSITSRVAEPGLAYGTDEDSSILGPDPMVNTYDDGDDPMIYARDRAEMIHRLRKDIADWAVEDGESYQRLRSAFNMLLGFEGRSAQFVARLVGGQNVTRHHKGDPDAKPPFTVVSADKQRQAVAFLGRTIFAEGAFDFSPELLNKLAAGRWWHWDTDAMDFVIDYPVHDNVLRRQAFVLFQLMNPFTVNRVYDNQLKVSADEDIYTVPELLTGLNEIIWTELDSPGTAKWSNRKPMVSSMRRSLQREHLRRLIDLVLADPGGMFYADCHSVVRMQLKSLGEEIGGVLSASKGNLDDYSQAHLEEAKTRIDKALAAEYSL